MGSAGIAFLDESGLAPPASPAAAQPMQGVKPHSPSGVLTAFYTRMKRVDGLARDESHPTHSQLMGKTLGRHADHLESAT